MSNTRSSAGVPWWVLLIAVVCALLLGAGAAIALLRPAMLAPVTGTGLEPNGAVRIYAGYLASRNLAIAIALLGAVLLRARGALSVLMLLAALVQLFDLMMDCLERRWALVPGVLVLGMLLLAGAKRISRA